MYRYMQSAEDIADQIAKLYLRSARWLTMAAEDIFERYMTKHNLSEAEARRLLNELRDKTSIDELIQKLEGKGDKKEVLAKLESPAYQARIRKLEELQTQLDQVMQNVYQQEKQISTSHYVDLANEAFYRTIFNLQQRAQAAFSFNYIDPKQIDAVVNSKWSGQNYSTRIWGNTRALAKDVKEELLINLVTGRTERETAEVIANKFAQGASNARRLVRTESAYLSAELSARAIKEAGVEEYQYMATLDLKTSEICRKMDLQIFKVSDRKVGVNCPPMHPWCRSTIVAVIDRKYLEGKKRAAIDPETGERILVPSDMTYDEWYQKYVKDGESIVENTVNSNPNNLTSDEYSQEENRKETISFEEVTNTWLTDAEGSVTELNEIEIGGTKYIVDGKNVKQNNSKRELEVADILKNALGGKIELVPEVSGIYNNVNTPDYLFNGYRYDLKELKGTSKDAIRNAIHKKRKQADNFVIDISECPLDINEINQQLEDVFTSYNTSFVNTLILIKDSDVLRILQRK